MNIPTPVENEAPIKDFGICPQKMNIVDLQMIAMKENRLVLMTLPGIVTRYEDPNSPGFSTRPPMREVSAGDWKNLTRLHSLLFRRYYMYRRHTKNPGTGLEARLSVQATQIRDLLNDLGPASSGAILSRPMKMEKSQ